MVFMRSGLSAPFFAAMLCLLSQPVAHAADDAMYFPKAENWERVDAATLGWDVTALNAALDYACKTDATRLVVLYKGKIAGEAVCPLPEDKESYPQSYWRVFQTNPQTGAQIEDVASIQKSVVSLLTGMAVGRKLVDIDAPVTRYLGKGWSKATAEQEAQIKIIHLLSASSGLDEQLAYESAPGTLWRYNTSAYRQLISVLTKVSGKDIQPLTEEWLLKPLGMKDTRWRPRPSAAAQAAPWGSPYGFQTSARDLARFGLLMLNEGVWAGKDLIGAPGWVRKATTAGQGDNPAYGYLWWLNNSANNKRGRGRPEAERGPLIESAPADLYRAAGGGDRFLYVVPSQSLVVARLGAPAGGNAFEFKLWYYLSKAVHAKAATP